MQQTYTIHEATQELEHDHERLHELIEQAGRAGDLVEIGGSLAMLHERLTAHFNAEERPGGLYDTLGFCAPEFRRPLGQLVDDHFRLSATLRELRDRVRGFGVDLPTVRLDVRRLVQAVAEHEKRELEMVKLAGARVSA
jgi:hypothetical protein